MPKIAEYRLTWQTKSATYELQNSRGERILTLALEDSSWFDWLNSVASFTFSGRHTRLTIRKESRRRGETYWYAYRRSGQQMIKKYLGRTGDLTFARLEEVSRQFAATTSHSNIQSVPSQEEQNLEQRLATTHADPPSPDIYRDLADLELATRLHAPRSRSRLVTRAQLLSRLRQASSSITLISAPAGSGKTTLLVQWLAESSIPAAWLSLESQDNEPVRFLSYLIAALQTLNPELGSSARSLLLSPHFTSSLSLQTVLTVLTNDLVQHLTEDIILVLDDYHVLTAKPIHQAMTFLVEHCPPHLHLVLATRVDPPLPLARLRARGQLIELRAAQLQFEIAEASTFLSEVMALDLPPEAIIALQKRTEGWAAGLQLAALSLQGRGNVEQFLADFTGSHRHVADYLVEEVLSRQSEEVQSFLLHTSIFARLTAPLCDVVVGRSDSETLLAELERTNLFLIPLDEQRQWYRYHQLFADLLRVLLRRRIGAEGIAALYTKASAWYECNGFPMEAAEAALAAGDAERAADLLEQSSIIMLLRQQYATLRRWVEQLPREIWLKRPGLCVGYAVALFIAGTADAYKAPLQQAEHLFQTANNQDGLGQVAMLQALAASLRGDALEGIRRGQQALALLPQEAHVARSASMIAMAEGYRRTGNVRVAWQTLSQAHPIDERMRHLFGIAGTAILHARLLVMQGKLQQAAESYQLVLESVSEQHEFALEASLGLAELLRERNELEAATAHSERVNILAREIGNEVLRIRAALVQARIVQAHEEPAQTEAAFAAALALARRSGHQGLQLAAQAYQARWWLAQGKMDAVTRWQVAAANLLQTPVDYELEPVALTLVRILIAQDEVRAALDLLDNFRELARTQGRTGSEIELLLLTALALQSQPEQAQQVLQQALLLAEPERYVRLFMDEGVPMTTLLRALLARWKHKRGTDYIHYLLKTDSSKPSLSSGIVQPSDPPILTSPLTPRERKVLRLLVAGLSNPEIANELVVSLNTVKTQVQSLYRKLQVNTRQQAIATARRLQLL